MSCDRDLHAVRVEGAEFQSLSGFLMSCDIPSSDPPSGSETRFQSLSGFLMSCDDPTPPLMQQEFDWFQSLSGFLMSCDTCCAAG